VRRGDGNRGCRHLISAQSFARAARRGQDDRQDMLVGKEEPLCTFCVWPWPSCVCVCVGDVPHTGAVHLRPCVLKDLLRSRGHACELVRSHILRIFSLPCGAIGFASQQHSLRLTSACNMHTQHVWSRHEPGPGSVCNITINNACNGITVHTRAVRRR